ncbi:hypothetical protein PR048_032871 [Dryococelus australis]|uniref:Uncharacterized protein n=1 Tax=Dryococelus australis TaxID=614101 RepID=A0ABQ9G3G7_9NEOP|nr:hypothetical protein PR048_032871 [Dryococelus australis]
MALVWACPLQDITRQSYWGTSEKTRSQTTVFHPQVAGASPSSSPEGPRDTAPHCSRHQRKREGAPRVGLPFQPLQSIGTAQFHQQLNHHQYDHCSIQPIKHRSKPIAKLVTDFAPSRQPTLPTLTQVVYWYPISKLGYQHHSSQGDKRKPSLHCKKKVEKHQSNISPEVEKHQSNISPEVEKHQSNISPASSKSTTHTPPNCCLTCHKYKLRIACGNVSQERPLPMDSLLLAGRGDPLERDNTAHTSRTLNLVHGNGWHPALTTSTWSAMFADTITQRNLKPPAPLLHIIQWTSVSTGSLRPSAIKRNQATMAARANSTYYLKNDMVAKPGTKVTVTNYNKLTIALKMAEEQGVNLKPPKQLIITEQGMADSWKSWLQ